MRTFCFVLLTIIITVTHTAHSEIPPTYNLTFMGIEVIGIDHHVIHKIRELSPLKLYDTISLRDKKHYCDDLIHRINEANLTGLNEITCSGVLHQDKDKISKIYLILEMHSDDKQKKFFRENFSEDNKATKIPLILYQLYSKLSKRRERLFNEQKSISESFENGFIDYDDPTLHSIAIQLSEQTPKYHNDLLEIIRDSNNIEDRQKAATLLAWAGNHDKSLEFALQWELFFDSDIGVRNSLSRAISFFVKNIDNENILKSALNIHCKLIELPSFLDRNKSLINILEIVNKNPRLLLDINPICKYTIHEISDLSILPNVGGYAKEISVLINEAHND